MQIPCLSLSDLTLAGAITTVIIWLLHIKDKLRAEKSLGNLHCYLVIVQAFRAVPDILFRWHLHYSPDDSEGYTMESISFQPCSDVELCITF